MLEVRHLGKTFLLPGGERMTAVDDVTFTLARGETLGLVGESGSGKSTLARLVLRLHEPTSGEVSFDGVNVLTASGREMRRLRARMQIVFQDPFSSLLPHFNAQDNVAEPLRLHGRGNRRERRARARELLELVGVNAAMAERYPYEFSGGQQQRIAIARALALRPDLLICDEPTSSLDVSIQAQILNLLQDVQEQLDFAMLFISHNLAVVEHLATRVAVMYRGRIVEMAPTAQIFSAPAHAYTRRLLSAMLSVRDEPDGTRLPPFETAAGQHAAIDPEPLVEIAPGHFVALSTPAATAPVQR
jgi:ABC-type oligopeptide transport system ATPase subunit